MDIVGTPGVFTAMDRPVARRRFSRQMLLGGIVLAITAFRIVWRFLDPPPPYTPMIAAWDQALAHLVYWLFFAALLWMPITGLLTSTYGGHATRLFNLIPTPLLLPKNKRLSDLFSALHLAGQWAVYALIVLHLAGVTLHLLGRRDGVLGRMLPPHATEPAEGR